MTPDFRRVLDALTDALLVADRSGVLRYANAAAETLLGWPAGRLLGQPITAVVPIRLRGRHIAGFNRFRATGIPRIVGKGVRVPALRRDGTEVRVELALAVADDLPGEELFIAALRDLESRVELERQALPARQLTAAVRAGIELPTFSERSALFRKLAEVMGAQLEAVGADLWLWDAASGMLHLESRSEGARPIRIRAPQSVAPEADHLAAEGARSRARQTGSPTADAPGGSVVGAATAFPLLYSEELVGVLIHYAREPLSTELVAAVEAFCALVAASLVEFRQREALEEAARDRAFLEQLSVALPLLMQGQDRNTTFAGLLEMATERTLLPQAALLLRNSDGSYHVAACRGFRSPITGMQIPAGLGLAHAVVEAGQTLDVEEYQTYPAAVPRIKQRGIRAALGAPLFHHGAPVGALLLCTPKAGRTFSSQDRATAELVARLASLALH